MLQTKRSIAGAAGKPDRLPAAGAGAIDSLPKESYSRQFARQLFEHYSRGHDVSGEARDEDGRWTEGGNATSHSPLATSHSVPSIGHWLKTRERTDKSQFRRDLENLSDEDLHAALEHVRSRGTAVQQHRLTNGIKTELRSRGIKPEAAPSGSDVALQAIDEGRNLTSVRQATGLKAGPEYRRMAKQAAAVYERIAQPWLHRAKRHIAAIENAGELEGETTPGAETAAARKALGIATHQEIMRLAHAAVKSGDEDFLRKFNRAMEGLPLSTKQGAGSKEQASNGEKAEEK